MTELLKLLDDGSIRCLVCELNWCPHTEGSVTNRLDSEIIWDFVNWARKSLLVEIPVFPSEGFWESVDLRPDKGTIKRMHIQWPATGEWLGFLNPGEGRGIIRELMIDFVRSKVSPNTICPAGHHSVEAEAVWQADQKTNRRHIQMWSLFKTGWCLYCRRYNGTSSDLIPNEERLGVWRP